MGRSPGVIGCQRMQAPQCMHGPGLAATVRTIVLGERLVSRDTNQILLSTMHDAVLASAVRHLDFHQYGVFCWVHPHQTVIVVKAKVD